MPTRQLNLPIGTQKQYNNVVSIYQSLVSKGIPPQAALDLVNQKVAEKGWTGYSTGDNKKFNNVDQFTDHLIDWHERMYPDSLKAKNFNDFWKGIQITPKYPYNPRGNEYKQELLRTRPGVKKRINFYRKQQGLSPLALNYNSGDIMYAQSGNKINYKDPMTGESITREELLKRYPANYRGTSIKSKINLNNYYNSTKGKTNYNQMVKLGYIPEEDKEHGYIYHLNQKSRSELEKDIPIYNRNDQRYFHRSLSKGDFVKWCSEAANRLNYNLGKPTTGDAWTRKGVYGDSVIWQRPEDWNYYTNRRKFNAEQLESGDIVDIKYPISEYQYEASAYGRGNSHTGTIVKNPDTQEVFIVHNVGGDIYSQSIRDFMNEQEKEGIFGMHITRISRPNPKPSKQIKTSILKPQTTSQNLTGWFKPDKEGNYPIEKRMFKWKTK